MVHHVMATLAAMTSWTLLPLLALVELITTLNDHLCQGQPDSTVAARAASAVRERRAALTAVGFTAAAATAVVPGRRATPAVTP